VAEWRRNFSDPQGGKENVSLNGEASADLRLLEKGDVVARTPSQVSFFNRGVSLLLKMILLVECPVSKMAATQECAKYYWATDRG